MYADACGDKQETKRRQRGDKQETERRQKGDRKETKPGRGQKEDRKGNEGGLASYSQPVS